MTTPAFAHLTLRRRELHEALTKLRPLDTVVLFLLVVRAHPRNARVWTTIERLSAELGFSDTLVTDTLDRLVDRGFATKIPSRAPLLSLEVGPLLVREGEAPENIPLEPSSV